MIKGTFPIDKLRVIETPFYFYDLKLLGQNLEAAKTEAARYGYHGKRLRILLQISMPFLVI